MRGGVVCECVSVSVSVCRAPSTEVLDLVGLPCFTPLRILNVTET